MNRRRQLHTHVAGLLGLLAVSMAGPVCAQPASAVDLGTLIAGNQQNISLRPGQRADDKLALDAYYAAELTVRIVSGSGVSIAGVGKAGELHISGGPGTVLRHTLIADKDDRRWQISMTASPADAAVSFVLGMSKGRPATVADRERLAAEAALAQADAQSRAGADRSKTLALYDSALHGWQKSGDACGQRNADIGKARYLIGAADYAAAWQLANDALAQHCEHDVAGHAAAGRLLAAASIGRSDLPAAIAADEGALDDLHQLDDGPQQQVVLRELADCYRRSGNTAKALDDVAAARKLAGTDAAALAALDVQSGSLHLQRNELGPAHDDYQQAVEDLSQASSASLEGQAWLGLMTVAQRQGDSAAESTAQARAEAACTRSSDQLCLQTLLLARADGLLRSGQAAAANTLYQQVLASAVATPVMQARARAGGGYAAMAQKEFAAARTQLEAAAKAYRALKDAAGEAPVQLALGDVLTVMPSAPAHSGYDRRGFYHYRFNEKAAPQQAYAEALRLARQAAADGLSALALADLARAERDQGRWADARRDIDASVALIEAGVLPPDDVQHRSLYLPDVVSIYDLQTAIAGRSGDAPVTDVAARALIEAERQRAVDADTTLPTASDLKRLVDPQWALLEYQLGEAASDAWLVTPAGVQAFRLPARAVIEPVANRLSQALAAAARTPAGGGIPADIPVLAQQLGQALLQPMAKAIGDRNLAIVSGGSLAAVPFALLRTADSKSAFGDSRQLVRLPSIASLLSLRARLPTRAERVAIVGEPVLRADDPRLHAAGDVPAAAPAADTSTAVAAVLDAAHIEKLLGFDASRAGLRQQDWDGIGTIHIATPTVINLGHPDHSGIVLSLYEVSGQAQNGFLRAGDIAALHLPVDLVVLADTAVAAGDATEAGDPYALARAFLHAGARRVLSGLWRVDPAAADAFMQRFYVGLVNQHLPAPAALRAAQLALRQDAHWQSPAIWSAYELEGDWR